MKYSLSQTGLNLIMQSEGLRLKAYLCSAGVPTIGYGHITNVRLGNTCNAEQAEVWLRTDVQKCVDAINAANKVELKQGQFDALVSFAFNLGTGALFGSTLWRKLQAGDYKGAANEFGKWVYAGKPAKKIEGLVARRVREVALFNT